MSERNSGMLYKYLALGLAWLTSLVAVWQWSANYYQAEMKQIADNEIQVALGPVNVKLATLIQRVEDIYNALPKH